MVARWHCEEIPYRLIAERRKPRLDAHRGCIKLGRLQPTAKKRRDAAPAHEARRGTHFTKIHDKNKSKQTRPRRLVRPRVRRVRRLAAHARRLAPVQRRHWCGYVTDAREHAGCGLRRAVTRTTVE